MEFDVNYLAVLVAGVASTVIGMIWYAPSVFGKQWAELSGISAKQQEEAMKKGMAKMMVLALVAQLVMALVLSQIAQAFAVTDVASALQLGFWTWLGFVATTTLSGVLWEGKKPMLWVLNNSYWLLSILVISLIVGLWAA